MNEVFRQEKKYWMTQIDMQILSGRLEKVMLQDPHNGAQGYTIRSLYFDTLGETDYQGKIDGLELRRKIRLRAYDPAAAFAMLEMKQKEGNYQKKRSLRLERADAQAVARGQYDPLLRYADPFAAECYGLLHGQCYRPKTIVEYRRKAFIARENKIRITLDHQIRATESCWDLFSPPAQPVSGDGSLQRPAGGQIQRIPAQLYQDADQRSGSRGIVCEQILPGTKCHTALLTLKTEEETL